MSFRSSALRAARPALRASRAAAAPIGRRAASSHAPSSNTPWAIGSAVVFGSLTAFILAPSGKAAAHNVHEAIDAKGQGAHVREAGEKPQHEDEEHANAKRLMQKERDAGDRPTLDEDPKGKMVHATENKPRTEIASKRDDEKPMRRGPSTGEDFTDNNIDGKHAQAGLANASSGGGSEKKESSGGDEGEDKSVTDSVKQAVSNAPMVAAAAEKAGDAVSKATSSDDAGSEDSDSKDADAPNDKEIADSLKRAERSNVPRAAMSEEAKGIDTQAKKDE